jgi:hypothetical protein
VKVTYTGHEPRTFLDYRDVETGKTLYCEPGGEYDIESVSARDMGPVDGWFTPVAVKSVKKEVKAAAAAGDSAPEASQ